MRQARALLKTHKEREPMALPKNPATPEAHPDYASLFPQNITLTTSSNALNANDGPLAYLSDLYQHALAMEVMGDDKAIPLRVRRPDLQQVELDNKSTHTPMRALTRVNEILEQHAKNYAGSLPLPEAIAKANAHSALPFHRPFEQIKAVLEEKGVHPLDLLQKTSYYYPNFCYQNFRSTSLRSAMLSTSGIDPETTTLLLDQQATSKPDFFSITYGTNGDFTAALKALEDVTYMCQRTGLSELQLCEALAVKPVGAAAETGSETTVTRSRLVQGSDGTPAASHLFGASFINNATEPAIALKKTPDHLSTQLVHINADRLYRMYKIIRLQHELKLPYAEVDLLIMSALRAEGQASDFHFTRNTLRVIGVFRYLHASFNVTTEEFAALLGDLPVYTTGEPLPFLDRVMSGNVSDSGSEARARLVLDNGEFDPDSEAGGLTLAQIGQALSIDEQTGRTLVSLIGRLAGKTGKTLKLFSALYRFVHLPRVLRLSDAEGQALTEIMLTTDQSLMKQLAETPVLSETGEEPDILDVIMAMVNVTQWSRQHKVSLQRLAMLIRPTPDTTDRPAPVPADWSNLITETNDRLERLLLTEQALIDAASARQVTLLDKSGTWTQALGALVSPEGWIITVIPEKGQTRESAINARVSQCLAGKLAHEGTLDADTFLTLGETLTGLINGALVAQEDVCKVIARTLSGITVHSAGFALSEQHILLLLRWLHSDTATLLSEMKQSVQGTFGKKAFMLWSELRRHAALICAFEVSPAALELYLESPECMDVGNGSASLELCYQFSCYRAWVNRAQGLGYQESDVLACLNTLNGAEGLTASETADRLARLIGWGVEETSAAIDTLYDLPEELITSASGPVFPAPPDMSNKTFTDFIANLGKEAKTSYETKPEIWYVIWLYYYITDITKHPAAEQRALMQEFHAFIKDNPGPLIVTRDQFDEVAGQLKAQARQRGANPVISFTDGQRIGNPLIGVSFIKTESSSPDTDTDVIKDTQLHPSQGIVSVSDIDQVMRLQSLCLKTNVSCQSLIKLSNLTQQSAFSTFHSVATQLLSSCTEIQQKNIEARLDEHWRDALASYLLVKLPSRSDSRFSSRSDVDDLSDYLLTDTQVSNEVITTRVAHATASLQHYLNRFFAHLENGYQAAAPGVIKNAHDAWRRYRSQYDHWRIWQQQNNHPENLIHPGLRPGKSKAFIELENELNQGKLTDDMVQLAVANYIGKFEHVSNLQVVSGYLDGIDPAQDTYHFIGRTNVEPLEYYWRSLHISQRDEKGQLSPLAWSEWERIGLPISGQIVQITTEDGQKLDVIRPIIIAGRPYVIWVERAKTYIPGNDGQDQKPTRFKKITVYYCYKQADGLWSPANELMCLDGTQPENQETATATATNSTTTTQPATQPDKDIPETNNFLKDESYKPGLIAVVDKSSGREKDPWFIIILYDTSTKQKIGIENKDYFVRVRDLLLIDDKLIKKENHTTTESKTDFFQELHSKYNQTRRIQHTYPGPSLISPITVDYETNLLTLIKDEDFNDNKKYNATPEMRDYLPPLPYRFQISIIDSNSKKAYIKASYTKQKKTTDTYEPRFVSALLELSMKTPNEQTFFLIKGDVMTLDGTAMLEADFNCESPGTYRFALTVSHEKPYYVHRATIYSATTVSAPNCKITRNSDQALYLDLTGTKELPFNTIRLNTLFGKKLVSRVTQSVDRVLDWETQTLNEPAIDAGATTQVDFHGANGRYLRELFLHLPFLVACRLSEEKQFQHALRWCTDHLFDPYRTEPGEHGEPALWSTRPLAEPDSGTGQLAGNVEPAVRAFTSSRHYRRAVFLFLVEHWQREGDHHYRLLSRDSLTQAWLCYQQALKLIGALPTSNGSETWTTRQLAQTRSTDFLRPLNPRLVELRKTLEQRVFNLRHALTIDGKIMPFMPFYASDEAFQYASGAPGGLRTTFGNGTGPVPAHRFKALLPSVQQAVARLIDMGRQLLHLIETEADVMLDVQLQEQQIRLADFTVKLQTEALNAALAVRKTLLVSKKSAELRRTFFSSQLLESRTALEISSQRFKALAAVYETAMSAPEVVKGALDSLPTIFGLANGGFKPSAAVGAGIAAAHAATRAVGFTSEMLATEAEYERRSRLWDLQVGIAEHELETIAAEVAEQDILIRAAQICVEESKAQRTALQETYVSLTTGFATVATYNWMVARTSTLYAPAYDAVLSLCLAQENAWRFETGDYDRPRFIRTSAWNDNYRGMLAGESLQLDVQEMEAAYLQNHERRMSINKTISIRDLLGNSVDQWLQTLKSLSSTPLSFSLQSKDFDSNYPGHYLRQITHVSVSFKLKSDNPNSLQNLSAVLTQTGSTTLIKPDIEAAKLLYGARKAHPHIKTNLRALQQIALSSTLSDDGRGVGKEGWLCQLLFGDGRYLPFEGTGAISNWTLAFPDESVVKQFYGEDSEKKERALLEDIQLHLVYTAADGGSEFAASIKLLMK
nr:neuraminidase-like domain-containing protein [Pseudomonas viridiflava]